MSRIEIVKGDLIQMALAGKFDLIGHQCNLFHTFGAGLAAQIKRIFPGAYDADKETVYGDPEKLGTYSKWSGDAVTVLNIYSQKPIWEGDKTCYDSMRKVFQEVNVEYAGRHIGLPMIGCGLAGGSWLKVKDIIEKELTNLNITVVEYVQI